MQVGDLWTVRFGSQTRTSERWVWLLWGTLSASGHRPARASVGFGFCGEDFRRAVGGVLG